MKAHTLILMSATLSLLASCSAEQEMPNIPQEKDGKTYLEVTAVQPTTPETRLTYTEDKSKTHVGMTVAWSASERLGVISYSGSGSSKAPYEPSATDYLTGGAADASTTFTGTITHASTGELANRYNFYRPVHTEGSTISTLGTDYIEYDYTGQSNTLTATDATTYVADPNDMSDFDVLYTTDAVAPASGITLQRASAILRFHLTLPANAPAINRIELSASSAVFYEKLRLEFNTNGKVLKDWLGMVDTIGLTVSGDEVNPSATRTITAYMMTPASISLTGRPWVKVSAVSGSRENGTATVYSYTYDFRDETAILLYGKTYSFDPSVELAKEEVVWAGSNIYWNGSELTFDPAGTTTNQYYQGVYFKWGSLVGISPAQTPTDAWSGNEIVYVPTYDGKYTSWDRSTASDYANDIPYYSYSTSYGPSQNSLYFTATTSKSILWGDKIGDICQFISETSTDPALKGYRMPRSEEFGAKTDWDTNVTLYSPSVNSSGTTDGKATLKDIGGYAWNITNTILPAAGRRDVDGQLNAVGNSGRYWSSSAGSASNGYYLAFGGSGVFPSSLNDRQFAYPVRCVKN